MSTDIESLDQQRMKYLKWYLLSFCIGLGLMLTRHFFRLSGLNSRPIGYLVLAGAVLALFSMFLFVVKSAFLEREIQQDPRLEAALNNEMVKSLTTESWVAAYLGTAAMTLFFAITWSFYPICDPVTIALSTIIAGAGASRAYFYFRYKTS